MGLQKLLPLNNSRHCVAYSWVDPWTERTIDGEAVSIYNGFEQCNSWKFIKRGPSFCKLGTFFSKIPNSPRDGVRLKSRANRKLTSVTAGPKMDSRRISRVARGGRPSSRRRLTGSCEGLSAGSCSCASATGGFLAPSWRDAVSVAFVALLLATGNGCRRGFKTKPAALVFQPLQRPPRPENIKGFHFSPSITFSLKQIKHKNISADCYDHCSVQSNPGKSDLQK